MLEFLELSASFAFLMMGLFFMSQTIALWFSE